MRLQRRLALLGVAAALLLVAVFAVVPRAQDQGYHLFADTAPLGPVPNALNVLSNVAFFAVGLWGLSAVLAARAVLASLFLPSPSPQSEPRLNIRV